MSNLKPSTRASVITRRTYNRPIDEASEIFETWEQTVSRVIDHQRWLWERQIKRELSDTEEGELLELKSLMLQRRVSTSGRTLWLGGTDVSKTREASQFNCANLNIETVYDVVDALWLLLQGTGVGFTPIRGTLNGFTKPIKDIEIIRSTRTEKGGNEQNEEFWDPTTKVWRIAVGDSAEAWAKSIGKMLAGKYPANKLILDFSNIRPAGQRLKGYGWISSGDGAISKAFYSIAELMSKRAGSLLSAIDILDIMNHLGTVLSSRRSAEIALMDAEDPEWKEFATAKKEFWLHDNVHRCQSNNSLVFYSKPTRARLEEIFDLIVASGGSEPGFINGEAALKRAPWFKGVNPSLRKGTRVFTSKGILPIESLENDFFEIYTLDNKLMNAGCKLSGRDKNLYKITLDGGHEYFATKEHTWPIYRKISRDVWCDKPFKVETHELRSGDCLVNTLRDSLYPNAKIGSYSEGFFVGWLLADGWITTRKDNGKKQIGLIVNEEAYDGPIRRLLEEQLKIIGSNATFRKSSGSSKSWELNTQNEVVWSWLSKFGVASKDCLPSGLFSSDISESFRKGFIDATFSADGNIEVTNSGSGVRICFSSKDKQRAVDLCDLLGFYGVKTSFSSSSISGQKFPNGKDYKKTYNCHTVRIGSYESITHFAQLFTLSSAKKQQKINTVATCVSKKQTCGMISISSVEKTNLFENVWDIGVYDITHTFQLAHGITGNCCEILLGNKSFCVSGDTPLITRDGIENIQDAVGKEIQIWNGEKWSTVTPRVTGENQKMLRVLFSDGSYLDCTEYHRFSVKNRFSKDYKEVMAKDLIGSGGKYNVYTETFTINYEGGYFEPLAYTYGAAYGDGYANQIDLYGENKINLPIQGIKQNTKYRQNKNVSQQRYTLPFNIDEFEVNRLFTWDRTSILNFFAGLADTDGSITSSKTIRIYQGNEFFVRKMQLLLTKIGIKSSVNLMADVGKSSNFNRLKAMWYLQITECNEIPCVRLDTSNGHKSTKKGKNQNIRSVTELDGLHTSYCFDEPERHMGVFNNTLTYQCNLVEIDIAKFRGDSAGLRDAVKLAARANYRQTCVNLKDGILQEAWHLNNEFLRLCGVGLTGIARRDDLGAYDYQELQRTATAATYGMADEFGTQHPKNSTTVKPSGCRPWSALTSTDGGILTLEELLSEHTLADEWCNYTGGLSVLQDEGKNRITKTYNNGVAEVFEVRMNHGLIVESTADHPWFVKSRYHRGKNTKLKYESVNQWVKTIDLKDQDIIEVCPGIYKSEIHSPLVKLNSLSLKMRGDAIEIRQPEFMNEDLSWMLGYLWGDGSMSPHRYRMRWIDQHRQHLEKVQRILLEQFGLSTSIMRASQERDAYVLEVGCKMLWHWLLKNEVSKYDADQLDLIPKVIRSSSASDIAAFIAGLVDSDGCIGIDKKTQKRNVMISSADRRFIKHVQDVGWSIGLAFGMSHNKLGQNLQMRKSMYLSTLTVHTTANALEMLMANSCKMQNETRGSFWMGENRTHLNGDTVGKVRSVVSVGMMSTYDIEIENNHWYYAGAVKSHNTLSKLMDTTEGVHKPLGRYMFNNVNFSRHDPIVAKMRDANYRVFQNPADPEGILVTFPVAWDDVEFTTVNGVEINIESAVTQLERYKLLQNNWTQQNTSVTISYDPTEIPAIIDWLMDNWDLYVGVSFIYRTDPTKTAADLGYLYLPQEVVTKSAYDEYLNTLLPVDVESSHSFEEIKDADCPSGVCPVK